MLAIVVTRDGRYALGIDAVLDVEELVVKPAVPAVMAGGLYAGQTLPDSGLPMLLLDGAGIAAAAGLGFVVSTADEPQEAAATVPGLAALLFDDLDGRRRAIALAAVDRVETVAAGAIHDTAGRLRLAIGETLVPLAFAAPIDVTRETVVLRLSDGEREIAYAIAEPLDIVALPTEWAPAAADQTVAGVAMVDGVPVEVIDAHAVFAAETATLVADAPLCLLHGDADGWMAAFLRPTLEAAGYRCTTRLALGERPVVALAMADAPPIDEPAATGVPVVQLRRERRGEGQGIYRYDRAGLAAAMAERVAGAGR